MRESSRFEYVGSELEAFSRAKNWREYWMSKVRSSLGTDVLEVGAGLGEVTAGLCVPEMNWVALEPDERMAVGLRQRFEASNIKAEVVCSTLAQFVSPKRFDSVIYIDVLEHIEDDAGEVALACSLLKPGGRLVILVPAHQSLYSPFDRAIGHFRRYNLRQLDALRPAKMSLLGARYLDSAGLSLSWGNARLLSQAAPTERQVLLWDRCVIPISRVLDRLVGYKFGKSLLVVWGQAEKEG